MNEAPVGLTVLPTLVTSKSTPLLPLELKTMRVLQLRALSSLVADQIWLAGVMSTRPVALSIGLAARSPVQPAGLYEAR